MITEYNEALIVSEALAAMNRAMNFRLKMLQKAYSDLDEAYAAYKEKVLKLTEEES